MAPPFNWSNLTAQLQAADGASTALDAAIAQAFGVPPGDYTESIEQCQQLVALAFPGWHLHLGFDVTGIFPYAVLSKGMERGEAEAPTVPLAILRAAVAAAGLNLDFPCDPEFS